jgi:hypothetical protein
MRRQDINVFPLLVWLHGIGWKNKGQGREAKSYCLSVFNARPTGSDVTTSLHFLI